MSLSTDHRAGPAGEFRSEDRALSLWAKPAVMALAATVVGAILRLLYLNHQPLWLDEVSSLRNGLAFGAGGLDGLARADQVAPLHSIVLWAATILGGDNEISLRMPSVLGGIMLIPLVYLVARRLFGSPGIAVVAAWLLAISPYAIWYAQEARMYSLLLTFTAGFVYLSWPVVERPLRAWELVALTVVTTVGYGMHHYMALVSGAFGLFLLVEGKGLKLRVWGWGVTQLIAALIFAGWLYLTRDKLGNAAGMVKPQFALWIPYTLYTYVSGFSFGPSTREIQVVGLRSLVQHAPAIALAALSAGILFMGGVQRLMKPDLRTAGRWTLIWLVAPIIIAVLATKVTNIRYNVRYVITCFPALMLIFALAIEHAAVTLKMRRASNAAAEVRAIAWPSAQLLAGLALVCVMLVSLFNFYTVGAYAKEDVRTLGAALGRLPTNTVLMADNNRVVKVLRYYHSPTPDPRFDIDYTRPGHTADVAWAAFKRANLPIGTPLAYIEYRTWETDARGEMKHDLETVARPVSVQTFPGVRLTIYRLFATPAGAAK